MLLALNRLLWNNQTHSCKRFSKSGPRLIRKLGLISLAFSEQSWVILTSGTLTPKPTALDLAPAVFVEIPMPSSGSTVSCVAGSASVAMPRKSDSSSTVEEFCMV
ncbi:hypothetical protein PVK06_006738 [Gossypium arboreum]|uniref:Uncharacterized protein n=1 Tax=Gossypium arboreum TaxID=29729 RepID=A0ABR0QG39_GOSAR|nr:hypothetical protein PVK06_006738 [Gossypium arboreum]